MSCDQSWRVVQTARTAEFQSPAGDSLSCDLWLGSIPAGVFIARFQSPAGDSLSCDQAGRSKYMLASIGFNRPQAIRCLATTPTLRTLGLDSAWFQSPAGDSLSCDPVPAPLAPVTSTPSFNRPQAIRCLATSAGAGTCRGVDVSIARRRFVVLRLQANALLDGRTIVVSIARRRFVVLRRMKESTGDGSVYIVSIARRRFVVLRLGSLRCRPPCLHLLFQSPAGDSLSCDPLKSGIIY